MTIRSGSQINGEVLDAAKNLRVIGRPGVGVDNVDLEAATRRGIVVMNSPMGNLVSTAELTLALLLAVARNIAQADASHEGREVGPQGVRRRRAVGQAHRRRRLRPHRPRGGEPLPGVRHGSLRLRSVRAAGDRRRRWARALLSFDELLARCDFITLHTTLTKETPQPDRQAAALAKVKPGVRIVNAARGELIDEEALLAALESGRVAGAALDVHAQEPPVDWRLAQHPRVVATPHIGAQTEEAQERVGTDIALQVRDFLKGGVIQQAVNFFSLSGDLYDQVRPAMDLAERLGSFLSQRLPGRGASASRSASTASCARSTPSRSCPRRWRACCAAANRARSPT